MSNYTYVAVDPQGAESRGILDVANQAEALRRIKEMGLFPTRVLAADTRRFRARGAPPPAGWVPRAWNLPILRRAGRIKGASLSVLTRQLATLIEAGMPLLRGLRTLHEQAESRALRRILAELSLQIESGGSFAEALALQPRTFNSLYVNMVKAGEIGGAMDVVLRRLAEFMEKAQRIKGKVKAAVYYPCAVLSIALIILTLLMTYVVPRFKEVFAGLLGGAQMPAFTLFVLRISDAMKDHLLLVVGLAVALGLAFLGAQRTGWGRWSCDQLKLKLPLLGPVFRKVAISRFSRTFGTLLGSGVPVLQALTIVKETAGNVVVGAVIADVHQHVKEGDPIAPALKDSGVFPAMVAGMVDVGEQTGALPELLLKIADTCDDEVDNSVSAMTSLLEPIMIVFLALVVGSIVIALFLPLVAITTQPDMIGQHGPGEN